ncbi:hypothetical protein DFJ58DRAFT_739642 [Suillus subalutaceus]|uniref:uncharacterized protein n=1 Tax=Suillus subalutaceus TaxID=48586 RepID=UPI001B86F4EC|nr:uncharacterized protein DFJ58DRAFT_739642 [Suillus subalutaceus]KAG1817028.1 hypothetical protein DFJ58DRAFT_739642 [Suillus subalutaceus]
MTHSTSSANLKDPAIFGRLSGDQDTIDLDGLAFGVFLNESVTSTSEMPTSHASATVPRLIPWSVEIDALYLLPPPRALQGTVERTQHSHHISVPYPLQEPKVIPLSATTIPAPQTLQLATSADLPITPTTIAPVDLAAPVIPVSPIVPIIVPVAPTVISIEPAPQQPVTPVSIQVSADIQKQITWHAKTRILRYLLTSHAMAGSDVQKRAVVDPAIAESIPLVSGMNVRVLNPTTSNQRQQLTGTWTSTFSNLVKLVRICVPFGFNIYPPVDSNILPDEFRAQCHTCIDQ